jgi:hypothetical protein
VNEVDTYKIAHFGPFYLDASLQPRKSLGERSWWVMTKRLLRTTL